MCTSLTLNTSDFYFGRNLDLEYEFGQQVVITPRNYPLVFRQGGEMPNHYALIGMATVAGSYPLYAEAANEKGLCIAGLNFPGNAYYSPEADPEKANISPFELPLWLLGQCATLSEARELLAKTHLIHINFSDQLPLSPLHWHIADSSGSLVMEATREGMKVYDNPVGVLTNNPPFDFHLTHLSQYLNLSPLEAKNRFHPGLELVPYGRGFGAIGLPGDASPASRFVRAAFLKWNSACEPEEMPSVGHFFHLLDAVAMTRGSVEAPGGHWEFTQYACCINASQGVYYYKTYGNNQITAVDMHRENLNSGALKRYPLTIEQQIRRQN
ncbi:MAG: choloylglycine hydrolase [Clostridia bacterium]|nr:choloylglycine hydrolase [Clostridia bacterium]